MNWDGDLPHNGYELLGLIIVGLVVLISIQAGAGIWIFKRHQQNAATAQEAASEIKLETAAIRNQVVNGHTQPLRADLDKLAAEQERQGGVLQRIESTLHDFRAELHGLRAELSDERNGRHTLGRELRRTIDTEVSEIRSRLARD